MAGLTLKRPLAAPRAKHPMILNRDDGPLSGQLLERDRVHYVV
jgi:hypothetical protein